MSTTIAGVDARNYLVGWLKGVTGMFVADVHAIPEDKWGETFGGCTRPASALAADAISLMVWLAPLLKGEKHEMDEAAASAALAASTATREGAVATLTEAADNLASAIAGASDEALNANIMAPWGMETPAFTLAHIAVSHVWYHDGQLNYIHTLLGDDKIHWMMG